MDTPFFIVCSGRSGSTLLSGMLNMHPDVHLPVELGGVYSSLPGRLRHYGDLRAPFNRRLLASDLAGLGHLSQFDEEFDIDYFERLLAERSHDVRSVIECFYETLLYPSGKTRIGDKTPDHIPYFHRILEVFPDARIVHLVRDGRDCALSSMAWRSGINFRNTWELARGWNRHNGVVAAFGRSHPNQYHLLRYEDLVDDTETTLRHLCAFLEIDYSEAMLRFQEGRFAQNNASRLGHHANLTRGIMRGNHGKWIDTMQDAQVKVYENLAGDRLRAFNYPVRRDRRGMGWRLCSVGWRLATGCRRFMRIARNTRNHARFVVATHIKRRLGIYRLGELRQTLTGNASTWR